MYCREIKTKHGQTRWAIDVTVRGIKRELLFANELAAHDALVIAWMDRWNLVGPEQTLRKLRMLAWDTLNFEHEMSDDDLARLQEIDATRQEREAGR